jgi:predicted RNA-binding Zn-ribbon protein involved in translation (DUF1610 family)
MTETTTKLWEERNLTDHKANLIKNDENDNFDTITGTKNGLTTNGVSDTTVQKNNYSKICPNCGEIVIYKWKQTLNASLKDGRICKGCSTKNNRGYSLEEENILLEKYSVIGTAACVKLLNNRSYGSVRMKAKQMGLKSPEKIQSKDKVNNKICGSCKVEMNKSNFFNCKNRKDGKYPTCKVCCKKQANSPQTKERRKIWYKTYRTRKSLTDVNYKLKKKLRKRFKSHLKSKGLRKSESVLKLLGCNITQFRNYIESKFKPGMSWSNYGYWGWHIDHILPCASFDFTKEEDRKKCWHYTNLQPLWMKENLRKWSKIL